MQLALASRSARISVDSTQSRREMGYLSMRELSESLRDQGLRGAAAGISATVGRGNSLIAALPGGGNAIASLAFQGMLRDFYETDFAFNMVPLSPPQIYVEEGALSIDFVY